MSETKRARPTQKRGLAKIELIKETARKLFSDKGFHNVSTNEIAKEAEISIGTLYRYYPDKTAIYKDLVRDLYENVLARVDPDQDASKPRDIVLNHVRYVMESHACQTGFQKEVAALSCQSDKFRKMEEPYRREAYQKIRMLLESQKKLLRIKDIPTAAYIIQLSMEAVVHELSFYDSSCDKEKVLKEYVDMIMCYLSPGQNR